METKNSGDLNKPAKLTKQTFLLLLACAGLSAFWVVFIWNFWEKGFYALGMNAFIFLSLFIGLFIWVLHKNERLTKHDLIWIIPLSLISLSFLIYDNPFLKIVSMLVFPVAFAIFSNYGFLENKKARYWDFHFITRMVMRIFSFFGKIGEAINLYIELVLPAGKARNRVIAKILVGSILFLMIAFTVFIPLLSSADAVFAGKFQAIYGWLEQISSMPAVYKIIAFIAFSVAIATMLFAWGRKFDYEEKEEGKDKIDTIISGIMLGGILALYLLFLWVQFERLWVGALPFDFNEVENLVKSGFWQLLFLSVINIIIFLFTYRKTVPLVQWILSAFTLASLLLLSSAGYRMGLYVTYYGFSYEKFFASCAVIYCAILLIWLVSRLLNKQRANIIKFPVLLFLWMYSLLTVFPVEQFILRTNIKLAQLDESKIRLFELTMLSPDVLSLVKRYQAEGLLKENKGYLIREGEEKSEKQFDWNPWIDKQEKIIMDKEWHEMNLMNIVYRNR